MVNSTALKAEFKQKTIEERMKGLAAQLFALPSPASNQSGPLFISLDSAFKPAAEYDGMLGSVMIESLLGSAFSAAANDNGVLDAASGLWGASQLDILAEGVSEYLKDQERSAAHGRGSFARTVQANHATMQLDDEALYAIGTRMDIEETLVGLAQSLSAVKREVHITPILEFCS